MITTLLVTSIIINVVTTTVAYSLYKEKPSKNIKTIYKDKIVYIEKPIEKIIYKEKVVYKDKTIKHDFIKKEEPKISKNKQELLDVLTILKNKKKKTKKDQENIYTIEKVLPNIK
jgi:hypothetical protein